MAGAGKRPILPKRNVIERMTRKGPECGLEMMNFLGCLRDRGFDESKCASQMSQLSECVSRNPAGKKSSQQKSTIMYHLKRLYYMQRR